MADDILQRAAPLLERNDYPAENITLTRLPGGANNQTFRIDKAGQTAVLKSYFRHPDDPRDRLHAEFEFSRFAWGTGVRCIPQPYDQEPSAGLGLYEFIDGQPPRNVTPDAIAQAVGFIKAVNTDLSQAATLPTASEACFSIADHLQTVDRRLERLAAAEHMPTQGAAFVEKDLLPTWNQLREGILPQITKLRLSLEEPLPQEDRCVSPSDFGFHNTLLRQDGQLVFIDFEYAGWDAPDKLVADFFCQPTLPVPMKHYDAFRDSVTAPFGHPARLRRRADLLLPIYRVKWCAIILNPLLAVGEARRRFAAQHTDTATQLDKARQMLKRAVLEKRL